MPRKDREASLEYGREYRSRPENIGRHTRYYRDYLKDPVRYTRHKYYCLRSDSRRKGYAPPNLTIDEFVDWYLKQEKRCGWCGSSENLQADHDHITGDMRGMKCRDCNLLEGIITKLGGIPFLKRVCGLLDT